MQRPSLRSKRKLVKLPPLVGVQIITSREGGYLVFQSTVADRSITTWPQGIQTGKPDLFVWREGDQASVMERHPPFPNKKGEYESAYLVAGPMSYEQAMGAWRMIR